MALDISSAIAKVVPDLLQLPAILSDTTFIRSEFDQEDHIENRRKGHISLGDQQSYHLQIFQRLY